jgi:hypothetical protein
MLAMQRQFAKSVAAIAGNVEAPERADRAPTA